MEDIKIGNGSISIWAIVAAVGGLLAFIAFFLAITKFETSYVVTTTSDSINGIDFLKEKISYGGYEGDADFTFWKIMPLLTMIMGLVTIVLAILPIFGVNNSGVKIAFLVCAIITFVFALLVFICTAGTAVLDASKDALEHTKGKRQIGAYFALIGGILAAGGAACDKFLKL